MEERKNEVRDFVERHLQTRECLETLFRLGLDDLIGDRRYNLKKHKEVIVGEEFVRWLIDKDQAKTMEEAVEIGQRFIDYDFMCHVQSEQPFKNTSLLYRFKGGFDAGDNTWRPMATDDAEDEYVKNQGTEKELTEFSTRRKVQSVFAKTIDPLTCEKSFVISSYDIVYNNDLPSYVAWKIDVVFDDFQWTIFRRWKQFVTLDGSIMSRSSKKKYQLEPLPPVRRNPLDKFDVDFLDNRMTGLNIYLRCIKDNLGNAFSDGAVKKFLKFIAPIQHGDIKSPNFVLPFKFVDY
eukprot:TRINITY_DN8816_c0_g1_i1.p1 TRINITY_DN8816_c0_g1~~TRINITY_DN8816_c0_g1_i1.p1  ORF type:complete len:292 (+),score=52.11 TRINITY_DN8816_c0_g1_i1:224-1099(+)